MRGRKQNRPVRVMCALLGACTLLGQSVLPAAAATGEHSIATTADTGSEAASTAGYTVSEEDSAQSLSFFKQIRVNSFSGNLVIRSGEDYAIRFTGNWKIKPQYQVQERVLTINGNVSGGSGRMDGSSVPDSAASPGSGKTVVLGEDTQTSAADEAETAAARSGAMILDGSAGRSAGAVSSWSAEGTAGAAENAESAESAGSTGNAAAGGSIASDSDEDISSRGTESEDGDEEGEAQLLSGGPAVVVTIPSGIGMEKLWITQDSGSLLITDIRADQVSVWTNDGVLRTRGTDFGTAQINAGDGNITLAETVFNSLYISSGEGDISVQSPEGLERCLMELKTGEGTITVNGAGKGKQYLQTGNGRKSLDVQAKAGDISVSGE